MSVAGPSAAEWRLLALPGLVSGRTALVSGGTGAIGQAAAQAFVALGMNVAVLGRSEDRLDEVTASLGGSAAGFVCDLTDSGSVDSAVGSTVERFGGIDVLVHCAALSEGDVPITELSDRQIEEVTRVNVLGSLYLARAVAREMVGRGRGRIVMVSSVAANQAMRGRNVYGPTKAALTHLTRQLAVELGPFGITANAVSPGQTPTRITLVEDEPGKPPRAKMAVVGESQLDRIPLYRRGELADFVGPILFFASDLSGYTTGADLVVDGGASVLR